MRLLDWFCGGGGAGMGYHRSGFEVVGVDLDPQPNYPFDFIQGDALELLDALLNGDAIGPSRDGRFYRAEDFAAHHASPPCQARTQAQRIQGNDHPEFVGRTRERLAALGVPYVIENVPGEPASPEDHLVDPVRLTGAMFPPLRVYRDRLFETSFHLPQPPVPPRVFPQVKMGRRAAPGQWLQIVGNWSGKAEGQAAMGIDWMSRNEMSEAIPPAYTEWVSRWLLAALRGLPVAA